MCSCCPHETLLKMDDTAPSPFAGVRAVRAAPVAQHVGVVLCRPLARRAVRANDIRAQAVDVILRPIAQALVAFALQIAVAAPSAQSFLASERKAMGLGNPASQNCVDKGGTLT